MLKPEYAMKRSRVYLLLCLLFLGSVFPINGYSQAIRSSNWYDSVTYASYMKSDWASLTSMGKEALKEKIDFYYLRVRMGDACLYTGNYKKAITHYNAALKFYSGDEYAKKMKYNALLDLGETDQAYRMASGFSMEQRTALNIRKGSMLDFVYLESGYSPSSYPESDRINTIGTDSIYGERELQKSLFYMHFGGRIRITPALSVFMGYTGMNIRKEKLYGYATTGIHRDSISKQSYGSSYYYSFPKMLRDTSFEYKLHQDDLYLNGDLLIGDGWKLSPAFHYFRVRTQKITPSYSITTLTDTAYYLTFDESWHTFDYQSDAYQFTKKDSTFSNTLLSLMLQKTIGMFSLELHASRSDFNKVIQKQFGLGCTWFPLGNSSLFGSFRATSLFGKGNRRLILEPSVGGSIGRYTWISGFATFGNLDLYNDHNGYIAYNQVDPIRFRAGTDLLFMLGKHLELYLIYRYYQKEYQSLTYYKTVPAEIGSITITTLTKVPYTNQSYSVGIKWKL